MKNYKIILSKEGSECHMPEDLWPEILSRLPVKSLLRFRCISKSWLSMINDPDFCRFHLENFKNNRDETHLLVVQGRKQNCVLRCSDTFKLIVGAGSLGDCWKEGSWQVECSIDGLVLLKSCKKEVSGFHKLRVWNPSIRKFHDLPSLPEIEASANSLFTDAEIGLGYDPLAKNYKNVKLIFVNHDMVHSVAVYTLGARSWKTIPFKGKGCSNWHCKDIAYKKKVYLRGSLYFTAFDADRPIEDLVSIDLSTELFSCTKLPSDGFDDYMDRLLTLVDDRFTLALFDFVPGPAVTMWVLDSSSTESESACWIKRYSFYPEVPQFIYHKKNGDLLISLVKDMPFRLPGGKKLSLPVGMVSAYNPEANVEELLLLQKGYRDAENEIHHVCGYVESLNLFT